jgi:hypothetical protein
MIYSYISRTIAYSYIVSHNTLTFSNPKLSHFPTQYYTWTFGATFTWTFGATFTFPSTIFLHFLPPSRFSLLSAVCCSPVGRRGARLAALCCLLSFACRVLSALGYFRGLFISCTKLPYTCAYIYLISAVPKEGGKNTKPCEEVYHYVNINMCGNIM